MCAGVDKSPRQGVDRIEDISNVFVELVEVGVFVAENLDEFVAPVTQILQSDGQLIVAASLPGDATIFGFFLQAGHFIFNILNITIGIAEVCFALFYPFKNFRP
ncbi:MAG: hypothetical protein BWK76_09435 [Desulfobulbaceae bacterium A2]|nr:MAG: hypothetical protein BWK76_09435 [Desulfobulbaceae bacterium A2]